MFYTVQFKPLRYRVPVMTKKDERSKFFKMCQNAILKPGSIHLTEDQQNESLQFLKAFKYVSKGKAEAFCRLCSDNIGITEDNNIQLDKYFVVEEWENWPKEYFLWTNPDETLVNRHFFKEMKVCYPRKQFDNYFRFCTKCGTVHPHGYPFLSVPSGSICLLCLEEMFGDLFSGIEKLKENDTLRGELLIARLTTCA